MDPWLTHTLTAVFGAALARLPDFWLKSRAQASAEWQVIVADLRKRVDTLEKRDENRQAEHLDCLKIQAELRVEVELLKAQAKQ